MLQGLTSVCRNTHPQTKNAYPSLDFISELVRIHLVKGVPTLRCCQHCKNKFCTIVREKWLLYWASLWVWMDRKLQRTHNEKITCDRTWAIMARNQTFCQSPWHRTSVGESPWVEALGEGSAGKIRSCSTSCQARAKWVTRSEPAGKISHSLHWPAMIWWDKLAL